MAARHSQSSHLLALPSDVLYELYRALAQVDIAASPRMYAHVAVSGNIGWLRLTHVCRRLREVGLSIATLWGRALPAFPRACSEILKRAGNAPLNLDLRYDLPNLQSHLDILPELFQRSSHMALYFISELHVTEPDESMRNEQLSVLARIQQTLRSTSLPRLSVLTYVSLCWPALDFPALPPITVPNLRAYTGHYIPLIAPELRTLVLLSDSGFNIERLLGLLRHTPHLERLSVARVHRSGRDILEAAGPAHLPNLQELHLDGNGESLVQLTTYVTHGELGASTFSWPRPCRIEFRPELEPDDVSRVLNNLRHRLPEPFKNPDTLTITHSPDPFEANCMILMSDTWDPVCEPYPDGCVVLEICEKLFEESTVLPDVLLGIAQVHAASVRTLHIPGAPAPRTLYMPDHPPTHDLQRRPWFDMEHAPLYRDALRLFRNVTEINVGPAARHLFRFLEDELALPALVCIIVDANDVQGVQKKDWSRLPQLYKVTPADVQKGHVGKLWFFSLCSMLAKRHVLGRRISRLVLRGRLCHLAIVQGDGPGQTCRFEDVKLDGAVMPFTDEVVDERTSCSDITTHVSPTAS